MGSGGGGGGGSGGSGGSDYGNPDAGGRAGRPDNNRSRTANSYRDYAKSMRDAGVRNLSGQDRTNTKTGRSSSTVASSSNGRARGTSNATSGRSSLGGLGGRDASGALGSSESRSVSRSASSAVFSSTPIAQQTNLLGSTSLQKATSPIAFDSRSLSSRGSDLYTSPLSDARSVRTSTAITDPFGYERQSTDRSMRFSGESLDIGNNFAGGPNTGSAGTEGLSRKEAFIADLLPAALEASKLTGVDPRMIIAQAAQETGWGRSVVGNNYFGIKSHGKKGGNSFTTHEVINGKRVKITDSFRAYSSPADSVMGWADFINSNPRYGRYKAANGLKEQAKELQESGYATDPKYGRSVLSIAKSIDIDGLSAKLGLGSKASDLNVALVQDGEILNPIDRPGSAYASAPASGVDIPNSGSMPPEQLAFRMAELGIGSEPAQEAISDVLATNDSPVGTTGLPERERLEVAYLSGGTGIDEYRGEVDDLGGQGNTARSYRQAAETMRSAGVRNLAGDQALDPRDYDRSATARMGAGPNLSGQSTASPSVPANDDVVRSVATETITDGSSPLSTSTITPGPASPSGVPVTTVSVTNPDTQKKLSPTARSLIENGVDIGSSLLPGVGPIAGLLNGVSQLTGNGGLGKFLADNIEMSLNNPGRIHTRESMTEGRDSQGDQDKPSKQIDKYLKPAAAAPAPPPTKPDLPKYDDTVRFPKPWERWGVNAWKYR